MTLISRVVNSIRKNGFTTFLRIAINHVYNDVVRPRLPRTDTTIHYNDVEVRPFRVGDHLVPIQAPPNQGGHPNPPEYEAELITQIERHVTDTDTVAVIGGGLGVSSVTAGRQATLGHVHTYEAGAEMSRILAETVSRNNVEDRTTVHHAIVATAERTEGQTRDANYVPTGELPDCDVLVMDCEGAETTILPQLDPEPRCIIVETHGNRSTVETQLEEQGYSVESAAIAERPPLEETLRDNGVYVLTGIKS